MSNKGMVYVPKELLSNAQMLLNLLYTRELDVEVKKQADELQACIKTKITADIRRREFIKK